MSKNLRPTEQRTHRNMIKMGTKMGAILGSEGAGRTGEFALSRQFELSSVRIYRRS
jgi:hypothetical protein